MKEQGEEPSYGDDKPFRFFIMIAIQARKVVDI